MSFWRAAGQPMLAGALLLAGCQVTSIQLCGEIPAGGCPVGRGGTCADPTCTGVYDCVAGSWTVLELCGDGGGGGSGGASGQGGAGGGSGGGAGGACTHVALDHAGEVSGCDPMLEDPDCPAVAAEAPCAEDACAGGCLDFFVCTKEGWVDVAYCDMEGSLVVF